MIPELGIGVVMMGNSSGMRYDILTEGVLALLMGRNPDTAVPALALKERFRARTGGYATYRNLAKLEIAERDGALYLVLHNVLVLLLHDTEQIAIASTQFV